MTNSTLAQALSLLKAELGLSLSVGTADDQMYYNLIETTQEWLASVYDWDILKDEWEMVCVGGVGGRYPTLPTADKYGTTVAINFDRPILTYVKYSSKWKDVGWGIDVDEMNTFDSDLGQTQDPVLRWQFKKGSITLAEIWPLGASQQTIRFVGQRKLNTLRSAGSFSTSLTLDLDARLVVLSIAVDILTRKEDPSARAKSERFQGIWKTLRAAESKSSSSFRVGGTPYTVPKSKVVPITVA